MNYVFDIDGTLTPSRQPINAEFKKFFLKWIENKKVYLITGSDYQKSVEQVGEDLLSSVIACYNSAGNVCYEKGEIVFRNDWEPENELMLYLNNLILESKYPIKCGNHIEKRIGMVNFSTIGRNCSREQRNEYFKFDCEIYERENICNLIMQEFPHLEAVVGGQISIDIYPRGRDKSQIIEFIEEPIHFFGDRTHVGGNDHYIAKKLNNKPNRVSTVRNWQDTYEILKFL